MLLYLVSKQQAITACMHELSIVFDMHACSFLSPSLSVFHALFSFQLTGRI